MKFSDILEAGFMTGIEIVNAIASYRMGDLPFVEEGVEESSVCCSKLCEIVWREVQIEDLCQDHSHCDP